MPVLSFVCLSNASRADEEACEFWVAWETRAACAATEREVEMVNGTIKVPDTGVTFSLGALYYR